MHESETNYSYLEFCAIRVANGRGTQLFQRAGKKLSCRTVFVALAAFKGAVFLAHSLELDNKRSLLERFDG